ncbi:MAG: MFS transporter [Acidimicrobiia bacterium]|nr:MFS transporter [Acidimicrobiia bacterium]
MNELTRDPRVLVAASVLATVATVFPGFLAGALFVQVGAELGVSEGTYGWALGSFFLGAGAGSIALGRLAQRIGARSQISFALVGTIVAQLTLAMIARSFTALIVCLVFAGLMNAATQTAVNLALSQARLPRLGLAISVKQSGMPAAALLSGVAIPIVALTVGWRWAFVMGAFIGLVALLAVRLVVQSVDSEDHRDGHRPRSSRRALVVVASAGAFLAFCAGALNAWTVASGVDAGLGEGTAGVMLAGGAAAGIAIRLGSGTRLDAMRMRPLQVGGYMVLIGALGMALLGVRSPGIHVVATLVAFGGGWIWPVFTNFGIVRANQAAASAATGITQTGVYVGVLLGPPATGWLIEAFGYPAMWLVVAFLAVIGSVLALSIANEF